MANEGNNSVTISRKNSGFPDYLDFDKLRTEGIAYLGRLSGQIWTDHNVHDPGITILETICYALMDLGYRTNLPVEDILSKLPSDEKKEDNFFTPAQILTCNPLTINDYRKLLMDIPEVRNAWLEPATTITDQCRGEVLFPGNTTNPDGGVNIHKTIEAAVNIPSADAAVEFLNGLYHVYIETEKDIDEDFKDDDPEKGKENRKIYVDTLIAKIKKVLMSHRNLCEDFEGIFILCKLRVGVCASIELQNGADGETVYMAIANKLREFFSPSPRFYTLPALLDKGKPIEDMFAGRPATQESHGFIDTDELEDIALRKEIHTSDIYNAIFEVEGVSKVTKLSFRNCGTDCKDIKSVNTYWKFHLPENHVPVFSMECSGFELTHNGTPLQLDTGRLADRIGLGWINSGKVLYKTPSAYLDLEIPKGTYHRELDHYFSIQNDFPAVYGIGEGDLPDDVSDKRKAWALQLKGYLFFFDQLLANYLSQLRGIRNLFSMAPSETLQGKHTYFVNKLTTVPGLSKLLRFRTDDSSGNLGVPGTVLVAPVSRLQWEETDKANLSADKILQQQASFVFDSLFALDEAADLLRNDFAHEGESLIKTYRTADDAWLYTIESSAADFVLLSQRISCSDTAARQQADSVQYAGVFEANYRSFLTKENQFTFNIELNMDSYVDYLGMLVEDDELYKKRREEFLRHLMSRFAEKFTDFVLLNWETCGKKDPLAAAGRFLDNYDEISRNRGRAYDYLAKGWNNENISGFEKKVKALSGMSGWAKDFLCNFTVDLHDELYKLDFSRTGIAGFGVQEKFDFREDAQEEARKLISSMADEKNYSARYVPGSRKYKLLLDYGAVQPAVYPELFSNSNDAEDLARFISGSVSQKPPDDAAIESSWLWKAELQDHQGKVIGVSTEEWRDEKAAEEGLKKLSAAVNITQHWNYEEGLARPGDLYPGNGNGNRFVDIGSFNIDFIDTIRNKPGRHTYYLTDFATNALGFSPLIDFDTTEAANEHCRRVIGALLDGTNFEVVPSKVPGNRIVQINIDGVAQAKDDSLYADDGAAREAIRQIVATVAGYSYSLGLKKEPKDWKFNYLLGYGTADKYLFESEKTFNSKKEAVEAAGVFYEHIEELLLKKDAKAIRLIHRKNKFKPLVYVHLNGDEPVPEDAIEEKLDEQQEMAKMIRADKPASLDAYVQVDEVGKAGSFVYKLVNKNRVPAWFNADLSNIRDDQDKRKTAAAASKKALQSVPFFCLGGDIFPEMTDALNNKRYRYQLKLRNANWTKTGCREIVLFESVNGYASEEEAASAFKGKYLQIIELASDKKEYGGKISIKPVELPDPDACGEPSSIVYLPVKTVELLLQEFGENWIRFLADLMKRYPVRVIEYDSAEFAALFCKEYTERIFSCSDKDRKQVYYFRLLVEVNKKDQSALSRWLSTRYFDQPDEAMAEFNYFARLLTYTGNYFLDCGCAAYVDEKSLAGGSDISVVRSYRQQIFIREVLAQSLHWFDKEETAWGKYGVERFISAIHSGNAFRNFKREENCHSFYVTCGSGLAEHPCKYDTAAKRNKTIDELYMQQELVVRNNLYGYVYQKDRWILSDDQGKSFAEAGGQNDCDLLMSLAEKLAVADKAIVYDFEGGGLSWSIDSLVISSSDVKPGLPDDQVSEWKAAWDNALLQWACYFPVKRSKISQRTKAASSVSNTVINYTYCVEIKLPGFNSCNEDIHNVPCDCGKEPIKSAADCYIAWKAACRFSTCAEALEGVRKIWAQLAGIRNYRAVDDCACNSFGIALFTANPEFVTSKGFSASSDVIAYNPQCYFTGNDLCEAVETACRLVNAEGFHLAEHILLRPGSVDDCNCEARKKLSACGHGYKFPDYEIDNAGGCEGKEMHIRFDPGTDPYSFIATVLMPSWSKRFKDEESRLALEGLLYREAPAHVLLRILWLRPVDFCRIEGSFRDWSGWADDTSDCARAFDPCRFLGLLTDKDYCTDDMDDCLPCKDPAAVRPGNCIEESKKEQRGLLKRFKTDPTVRFERLEEPYKFLNQVNDVFCFRKYCRTVRTLTQVMNSRLSVYKETADVLYNDTKQNPLAETVNRFLLSADVDIEKLEVFVREISANAKPPKKKMKTLDAGQQQQAIQVGIAYYLDKAISQKEYETSISQLQLMIETLPKGSVDGAAVYSKWKPEEVSAYKPEVDIGMIRKILQEANAKS